MGKLELLETLKAHDGRAWSVAWHPMGHTVASCGEDKTICLWSKDYLGKWQCKVKLTDGHMRTIREISWSPCGNYLASASFDATVGIWDKKNGEWECSATIEGHENEVKSVSWSSSGKLATCSRDKSVWIWELSDDSEFECVAVLMAHTQDVKKVRWHPVDDVVISASYDNTIKLFKEDSIDWSCQCTLTSHDSTVWSVSFDKTGSKFASASDDKTVKIWKEFKVGNKEGIKTPENEPVWKCVCTLSGYHNRAIYDVSWCALTDVIATACGDDSIRLFQESPQGGDMDNNFELVCTSQRAHSQDVNAVTWNPVTPGLLASCSDDGLVKLWQFHQD